MNEPSNNIFLSDGKIGIIDNDFVMRKNHNFPNLALMKISSYLKSKGNEVELIGFNEINPDSLFPNNYDKIIVSKVFLDTKTPDFINRIKNVIIGGSGFFYDKAIFLDKEIEHAKPDYNLYNKVFPVIKNKKNYTDISIGFTTRGCFRKCPFCINRNYNKVELHSPVLEFLEENRPIITMLDDNVLGLSNCKLFLLLDQLKQTGKKIQFKQGMDIRLITEERAKKILELKYEGDYYFAFDMWKYRDEIIKKLKVWHVQYYKSKNSSSARIYTNFYVFCAFDYENKYNLDFWINDINYIYCIVFNLQ